MEESYLGETAALQIIDSERNAKPFGPTPHPIFSILLVYNYIYQFYVLHKTCKQWQHLGELCPFIFLSACFGPETNNECRWNLVIFRRVRKVAKSDY